MANVREYNNKQQLLFPPSIGDFIEEGEAVHIIDEVVESIDLKEYYEDITEVGNPSYDPRMKVKVIFGRLSRMLCLIINYHQRISN